MVALRQHGLPKRVCFTHNRFRTTCRHRFLPGTSYNRQGRLWIAEVDEDADGKVDTRSSYRYDDSGIRVAQREQVDSDDDGAFDEDTTTVNLVDHRNPTGYQQVLEETQLDTATEAVQRRRIFTLGLDVISQQDAETAYGSPLFLLYDGHGSTRALAYLGDYMMEGGLLVAGQLFRYDAYGNSIDFDPTAAYTNLLYSGEHLDTATNQQYLRARYYDLATGRFNRLDPFAGNLQDPASLHKYLYASANPIQFIDPSGTFSLIGMLSSVNISGNTRSQEAKQKGSFLTRGFRNKVADVYMASERSIPGIPSHWFIYVNKRRGNIGMRYDVGAEGFPLRGLSRFVNIFGGYVTFAPSSLQLVQTRSHWTRKVGAFTQGQWILWTFAVLPLGGATEYVPFSIPGYPLTFNCYKWTVEGVVAAWAIQILPIRQDDSSHDT